MKFVAVATRPRPTSLTHLATLRWVDRGGGWWLFTPLFLCHDVLNNREKKNKLTENRSHDQILRQKPLLPSFVSYCIPGFFFCQLVIFVICCLKHFTAGSLRDCQVLIYFVFMAGYFHDLPKNTQIPNLAIFAPIFLKFSLKVQFFVLYQPIKKYYFKKKFFFMKIIFFFFLLRNYANS